MMIFFFDMHTYPLHFKMNKYLNNKTHHCQMSEAVIITTALEEIKGSGIISVGQDVNVDVDFVLQILKNGKGIGTISLKTIRQDIFNHIKQNYFSLNGRVSVSGDKLIAVDCRMTSVTEIGGKLTFQSLEIFPKSLDTKPQKELYLHASVLNMYQTRNVRRVSDNC